MAQDNGSDRFLSPEEVVSRTTLSRTTLWRMVRRGDFPKKTVLSPGRIGWSEKAVNAWIAERTQEAA